MPPLYGIACVAFIILYINERLLVCYYYREPPCFDEKMTLLTMDLIEWVPYMLLPMAFWQLGNRQIFETELSEIDFKSDIRLSQHTVLSSFSAMNPFSMVHNSAPFWCFFFLIAYVFIGKIYCP